LLREAETTDLRETEGKGEKGKEKRIGAQLDQGRVRSFQKGRTEGQSFEGGGRGKRWIRLI